MITIAQAVVISMRTDEPIRAVLARHLLLTGAKTAAQLRIQLNEQVGSGMDQRAGKIQPVLDLMRTSGSVRSFYLDDPWVTVHALTEQGRSMCEEDLKEIGT